MTKRLALSTALVFLAIPLAAAAETVGFVAGIDGKVGIRPSSGKAYALASVDQALNLGDAVRTGRDSYAKIVLADDTVISVGEETILVLDEIAVGPQLAAGGMSVVRQLGGQLRTSVGEAFGAPSRLEIHTPTATMGVKGTVFDTVADEEETLACVEQGEITARNSDPAIGPVVDIPEGFCRTVLAGEAPGELTPPPAQFTPLGPGPSNVGSVDVLADQLLRDDANQAYYGWLGGVAPVASGPDETIASYDPPVNAFDDAIDAILGSGGISSNSSGGGIPGIGGGEVPGEGMDDVPPIGGGEVPGEGMGGVPPIGGGEVPGEGMGGVPPIGGGEVPGEGIGG